MSAHYAGTRSRPGRVGHGQELARLWPRSDMLAVPAPCAGHPLAPSVCAGPEGHPNTDTVRQFGSAWVGLGQKPRKTFIRRKLNIRPALYSDPIVRRRRRAASRRVRRTAPVRSACLSAAKAARVPDRIAST